MKTNSTTKKSFILTIVAIVSLIADLSAQQLVISGNSSVIPNTSHNYTVNTDLIDDCTGMIGPFQNSNCTAPEPGGLTCRDFDAGYMWTVTGGTITGCESGSVTIMWGSITSSASLTYRDDANGKMGTMSVNVCNSVNPVAFTVTNEGCNPTTISITDPPGATAYWQSDAFEPHSDTEGNAIKTITDDGNHTFYAAATDGTCWSTSTGRSFTVPVSFSAGELTDAGNSYTACSHVINGILASAGSGQDIEYRWLKNGTAVASTQNYPGPETITTTTTYERQVRETTGSCNTGWVTSGAVTYTVIDIDPGTISVTDDECNIGESIVTSTDASSGLDGGTISYTWTVDGLASSYWEILPGNKQIKLKSSAPAGTYSITRQATTSIYGCSAYTSSIEWTIVDDLNPGSITWDAGAVVHEICPNTNPGTSNGNAASGGEGTIHYQWQVYSGGEFVDIPGETNETYDPGVLTTAKTYKRKVWDDCRTKYSNQVTISMKEAITSPGDLGPDRAFCYGQEFTITDSLAATGSSDIAYEWVVQSGQSFPNQNGRIFYSGLNPGNSTLTQTTTLRRYARNLVSNGCDAEMYDEITISVNSLPATPPTPTSTPVCGGAELLYNGNPPAGITWFWQKDTDTDELGSSSSYPIQEAGTYYLRAKSNSGCWSVDRATIVITEGDLYEFPPSPTVLNPVYCNNGVGLLTLSTSTQTDRWFIDDTSTTPLSAYNYLNVPFTGAVGRTFHVESTDPVNGCKTRVPYTITAYDDVECEGSGTTSAKTYSVTLPGGCTPTSNGLQWDVKHEGHTLSSSTSENTTVSWSGPSSALVEAQYEATCGGSAFTQTLIRQWVQVREIPPAPDLMVEDIVITYDCNTALLEYVGDSPDPEIKWYWQDSPLGTSENNQYQYQVYEDQTYFLRSKNIWTGWGGSIAVVPSEWRASVLNISIGNAGCGIGLTTIDLASDSCTSTTGLRLEREIEGQWYKVNEEASEDASGNKIWLVPEINAPTKFQIAMYPPNYTTPTVVSNAIIVDPATMAQFPYKSTRSANYVKTYSSREPLENCVQFTNNPNKVLEGISYLDDLGRRSQEVIRNGTPLDLSNVGKDLVTMVDYDIVGRVDKTYLPYPEANNEGTLKANALNNQQSYYQTRFGSEDGAHAHSSQAYEASPLNRVNKLIAPGYNWRDGSNHNQQSTYTVNDGTEQIIRLEVQAGTNTILFDEVNGFYEPGELTKSISKDENAINRGEVITFSNNEGQVVLKKVKIDIDKYTSTYYVYDDFEQLRHVIQPEGIRLILDPAEVNTTWASINTDDFRSKWMFSYEYDGRRRMTGKRVPGADWVYMVYDRWDRLVLTQDGKQRKTPVVIDNGTTSITAYRGEDYQVSGTGKLKIDKGFSFSAKGDNEFKVHSSTMANTDSWTFIKYDHLNRPILTGVTRLAGNQATVQAVVDVFYGNGGQRFETYNGGGVQGYTNNSFPSVTVSDLLTVAYFDHYNFTTAAYPSGAQAMAKGLPTGGKTRILGEDTWITYVTHYDNRLRPIRNTTDNHLGGQDVVDVTYRNIVSPKVTTSVRTHTDGSNTTTIEQNYEYDHLDRVKAIKHKVNGGMEKTILALNYNDLGQIEQQDLGGVQEVDYAYNVRGWLRTINGGTNLIGSDKFGMELQYDSGGGSAQYNGNISTMKWKTKGMGQNETEQRYEYTYDPMSRMTGANYVGAGNRSLSGITYDHNSNLQTLTRGVMDSLNYDYEGNSKMRIDDALDATEGFADKVSQPEEYLYDKAGNSLQDLNNDVVQISYNILNLPELVSLKDGRKVKYSYTSTGAKIRKQYIDGSSTTTIDYVGGIHYKNGEIDYLMHGTGRVLYAAGSYIYEYNLKDHLGNIRATIAEQSLGSNMISNPEVDNTSGYPANQSVTVSSVTQNGETYVKAVTHQSTSTPGVYPISGTHLVTAGETYRYRLKGYRSTPGNAYLYIWGNTGNLLWAGMKLPQGAENEAWIENDITIPAGVSQIKVGVLWSGQSVGDEMFINAVSLQKVENLPEVVQREDYYPFGLSFSAAESSSPNVYRYNGVELDPITEYYEMAFRGYDATTASFLQVDPLTEMIPSIGGYHFGFNNPIRFNDPLGLMGEDGNAGADGMTNEDWIARSRPGGPNAFDHAMADHRAWTAQMAQLKGNPRAKGRRRAGQDDIAYSFRLASVVNIKDGVGTIPEASVGGRDYTEFNYELAQTSGGVQTASILSGDYTLKDVVNYGMAGTGFVLGGTEAHLRNVRAGYAAKGTKAAQRVITKVMNPSIAKVANTAKVLGWAGVGLNAGIIGYNWANGQDVTASQAADLAIGAGLILRGGTVAVFSAPAALIAVGAYGVLDSVGAFDGIKESLGGNTVIVEGFGGF